MPALSKAESLRHIDQLGVSVPGCDRIGRVGPNHMKKLRLLREARGAWWVGAVVCLIGATAGLGQQKVPFQNGIPVAPLGLSGHRLPDKPME